MLNSLKYKTFALLNAHNTLIKRFVLSVISFIVSLKVSV